MVADILEHPAVPALRLPARATVEAVVDRAIDRYIAERHTRVGAFVDSTYSRGASFRLHRKALGWDVVRAPANLALSVPYLGLRCAAGAARVAGLGRTSDWLGSRRVFLATDVSREVEWRLFTHLLELPYAQADRRYERDALAEIALCDPAVAGAVDATLRTLGRHRGDADFVRSLEQALAAYSSTRIAAGDLATALMAAATGALAVHQLTPGSLSLGAALAHAMAQKAAIASFPLGAGFGGVWYGAWPATATAATTVALTGGLMAVASVLAAFSGLMTDPIQRRMGLHDRRLHRLIDALERAYRGDGRVRYPVRDHYVARILDLMDVLATAYRAAR